MNSDRIILKSMISLSIKDFRDYPVWTSFESDPDEYLVTPVDATSSDEIDEAIDLFVLCEITLNDRSEMDGYIWFNSSGRAYGMTFFRGNSSFDCLGEKWKEGTLDELSSWLKKPINQN